MTARAGSSLFHRSGRLLTGLLALLATACIPVQVHHDVPAQTEAVEIPPEQFTRIVVAPYFHRAEVQAFSAALAEADTGIEVVDAGTLFREAFPERDPNSELAVDELLDDAVRGRIRAGGVRFIVVLSPYESAASDSDGVFIGVYAHGSSLLSASLMAGLVDLEDPHAAAHLKTRAEGKDTATWILPYLGLFIFGSTPDLAESVLGGSARQVAGNIRSQAGAGPVKISVLAGNWEAAQQGYAEEQRLELLKAKALQGDAEAQWELYAAQPAAENLLWVCRAADQGHAGARRELAKLYYYGPQAYRAYDTPGIDADLPRACLWFQLAGLVQLTEEAEQVSDPPPAALDYASAEVERTAGVMSAQQLEEGERLLQDWQPGQCARDIARQVGGSAGRDPRLDSLCMAADQGSFQARDELGRSYFLGTSGLHEDLPRAYLWYRLAARVYLWKPAHDAGSMQVLCDAMTPAQRRVALQLLAEWKPGQCERDLGLAGSR